MKLLQLQYENIIEQNLYKNLTREEAYCYMTSKLFTYLLVMTCDLEQMYPPVHIQALAPPMQRQS